MDTFTETSAPAQFGDAFNPLMAKGKGLPLDTDPFFDDVSVASEEEYPTDPMPLLSMYESNYLTNNEGGDLDLTQCMNVMINTMDGLQVLGDADGIKRLRERYEEQNKIMHTLRCQLRNAKEIEDGKLSLIHI